MAIPNILLISTCCLRADHMSCYGYHLDTTPNITRLVTEGTIFEQAYSTSCWTPPAHASLVTGLYPSCHGAFHGICINDSVPTMAELLGKLGYYTIGFVDNGHMGSLTRSDRGFHEFYEVGQRHGVKTKNFLDTMRSVARQHMPLTTAVWRKLKQVNKNISKEIGLVDDGAHRTTLRIIEWLKTYKQQKQPFFMLLCYNEMHPPFGVPHPYKYRYLSHPIWQVNWPKIQKINNNPYWYITGIVSTKAQDFEVLKALYDAQSYYVDKWLGQLFDYMQRSDITDNTLIIFTSPHGYNIGEHGLGGLQGCLYETLVHVPLIMRYPDVVPPGLRIRNLVQLTDILPTILEIAGGNPSELKLQGYSLLPIQPNNIYREYVIAERSEAQPPPQLLQVIRSSGQNFDPERFRRFTSTLRMIRQGDYKCICGPDDNEELFNLISDPNELHNLATQEPQRTRAMAAKLKKWLGSFEHRTSELEEPDKIEQSILEHLREMGYRI